MGASASLHKSIYKLIKNLSIFTVELRTTNVAFFLYNCID